MLLKKSHWEFICMGERWVELQVASRLAYGIQKKRKESLKVEAPF